MESPVKKLDFNTSDKENKPFDADLATLEAEIDANHAKPTEQPEPAKAEQEKQDNVSLEAEEPLLQENPQRFVLFPIKYHEVRVASRSPLTR